MKTAIEQSIYYSSNVPYYLNSSVVEFYYEDKNSLSDIIKYFDLSIDIKTVFKSPIIRDIVKVLPQCWESCLLEQIDCIFIIDRYDRNIKISNGHEKTEKIAIIRLDSVKCEFKSGSRWGKWVLIGGLFSAIGIWVITEEKLININK